MSETFRVLVTGSRNWWDSTAVFAVLDELLHEHGHLTVVHGDCPEGADAMAKAWVRRHLRTRQQGTAVNEGHAADWKRHKRRAGFVRNDLMVSLGADLCVAFIAPCTRCGRRTPHGSHGATHCAEAARAAGIEVRVYRSDDMPALFADSSPRRA